MIKVSLSKAIMVSAVIVLSILLVARDVFSISLNKFVYFGICAFGIFLTDKNLFVQFLSFIFPLMCGLPGTYVLLVAVARFVLVEGLSQKTMLFSLFVIVYEMLASIWYSVILDNNMIHQILAMCLFLIMLHNHTGVDYYQCIKMYWLGTIVVAFVIVWGTLINAPANWLSLFAKGWFRFGEEATNGLHTMTLRLDANTLAYYSLVSTMFGLIMILREKGMGRSIAFAGTVFLVISGFLTVSRSWLLIAGICLALFMLTQLKDVRYLIGSYTIVFFLVLVGSRLFERVPEILAGMTTRMTDETMAGGGGRVESILEYLLAITQNIRVVLIGAGTTYYMEVLDMGRATHNGTMQILVSYGIFGSMILLWGMLSPLRKSCIGKAPLLYWLPFIACVLFAQTIQFINPAYLIYPYIITVYAVIDGGHNQKHVGG